MRTIKIDDIHKSLNDSMVKLGDIVVPDRYQPDYVASTHKLTTREIKQLDDIE